MENDDQPIGHILSRKEALQVLGMTGAALLAGCVPDLSPTDIPTSGLGNATDSAALGNLPSCVVRPELAAGPYFVDELLNRSDIRSDPSNDTVKEGAQLDLTVRVSRIDGSACEPLEGAQVDLWHCDALGVYSDVLDPNFGSTRGEKFLRGYQLTDSNGVARFTTIYPGWYQGRAVHIHFKIRTPSLDQNYDFTSQFFFDEGLSTEVYRQVPYAERGAGGMLSNDRDGIFQRSEGQTLLDITSDGDVYAAIFDIGLQLA